MWNEFLPISMPITAGELSSFRDMACSCLRCPLPAFAAGRAGARPDHSISGQCADARFGLCAILSIGRVPAVTTRERRPAAACHLSMVLGAAEAYDWVWSLQSSVPNQTTPRAARNERH